MPPPSALPRALALAVGLLFGPTGAAAAARAAEDAPARVEHFVLEEPAGAEPRVVALAEIVRHDRGAERVLQWDLRFADGPRVVHVEARDSRGSRLVWRELDSRGGRTLLADWAREEARLGLFWRGLDGRTRGEWIATASAVLPLSLVELARHGQAVCGRVERLEPLAGALEPVSLTTRYVLLERTHEGALVERTLEIRREDGTGAGCFVFRGGELVRFQLQDGGPWARRIDAAEHARRLQELAALPTRG